MKKLLLFVLCIATLYCLGCAAGAATAGYAAKASTCDSISSDGMKGVADVVKAQVASDLRKEGALKSDHEIFIMVIERLKREGYILQQPLAAQQQPVPVK